MSVGGRLEIESRSGHGTRLVAHVPLGDAQVEEESGARGYLLKRSVTEELLLAIRAAHRGEIYLSPSISQSLVADSLKGEADAEPDSPFDQLTPREREVLQLVAEGRTNAAIAELL